jgi:predicted phosphodiesterase
MSGDRTEARRTFSSSRRSLAAAPSERYMSFVAEFKPTPPASRPMAFISDIHGNLEALDAVLGELARYDVGQVYVAGDLVFGGPDPLGVFQRLQSISAICTRGLSDHALVSLDPSSFQPKSPEEAAKAREFVDTRRALGDLFLERIRRLPWSFRIPMIDGREIVMAHGAPGDPNQEISHDLEDEEILSLISDEVADIIVCGATHVPFQVQLGEVSVVNVGSVGDAPEGRVAHFTVLTPRMDGTEILQTFVTY